MWIGPRSSWPNSEPTGRRRSWTNEQGRLWAAEYGYDNVRRSTGHVLRHEHLFLPLYLHKLARLPCAPSPSWPYRNAAANRIACKAPGPDPPRAFTHRTRPRHRLLRVHRHRNGRRELVWHYEYENDKPFPVAGRLARPVVLGAARVAATPTAAAARRVREDPRHQVADEDVTAFPRARTRLLRGEIEDIVPRKLGSIQSDIYPPAPAAKPPPPAEFFSTRTAPSTLVLLKNGSIEVSAVRTETIPAPPPVAVPAPIMSMRQEPPAPTHERELRSQTRSQAVPSTDRSRKRAPDDRAMQCSREDPEA
ncbi:hypothetical protein ONZ51_g10759 [Trametes cubensis]|uniref:Uncharacterized protein n=1 Tax=Trametes cubensis TaxID=1111947 RepID=A0AAD7X4L1_9APHY|nr:hypothetical protein ONZ51_g10759 [Trametes cubensis]